MTDKSRSVYICPAGVVAAQQLPNLLVGVRFFGGAQVILLRVCAPLHAPFSGVPDARRSSGLNDK